MSVHEVADVLAGRDMVLFDFDGTLADTTRGVLKTVRYVLHERGEEPSRMGDLRRFIGPPLVDAFQEVCGYDDATAREATAQYRTAFDMLLTPADYPTFPGIPELLARLRAQGRRLAVATSRLESRAQTMIGELGIDCFESIMGLNPPARRSKVDAIRDALAALGDDGSHVVMVGDSHFDVEGAGELGIPCIGVTWGATTGADEFARAGAFAVCGAVVELERMLLG